jgi:hypothetical protein
MEKKASGRKTDYGVSIFYILTNMGTKAVQLKIIHHSGDFCLTIFGSVWKPSSHKYCIQSALVKFQHRIAEICGYIVS